MFLIKTILVFFLLEYSQAQNACDYTQTVQPGQTYYIYSPGYPYNYTGGVKCRWYATCPNGYNCRLECTDILLPPSSSCSLDSLLISRTGDRQLTSANYYCGQGTVTVTSAAQAIAVGLNTSPSSPGGRFLCSLTAQVAATTSQCSCGYKKTNRIVGGQETSANEYPMMAGLIYKSMDEIKCGAVIIDTKYVLTAAHCVVGKNYTDLAVIVGATDISTYSPTAQRFNVSYYVKHEQYAKSTYDYDIAVVYVIGQIIFNSYVGPVCLPFKYVSTDLTGFVVTLLGWGTLYPGGETSDVLRKVDVSVISQASCTSKVSTLTARQVCTYTQGKDACQDDSGGPALYTDPTSGLLFNLGIISFGRFCASTEPGVNTRVPALLNWILANAPAEYCRK